MMNTIFAPTFIGADNHLALWTIITGIAALSIFLEQQFRWAAKVTGCVLAMGIAIIFSNLKLIPTESATYDHVWSYIVPLAIPLLLFKANVRKIWKDSGRLLILFLISSAGTMTGGVVGFFALRHLIPSLYKVAAMMTGSYTGGSVNFAAMSDAFDAPGDLVSAAVISDNLLMALYFFVLIAMPSIALFRRMFKHPLIKEIEERGTSGAATASAAYWEARKISLVDIALCIAITFSIVLVSHVAADFFSGILSGGNVVSDILRGLLGNKYLIMTTIAMLLATFIPNFFGKLGGAQEIGTFFIYMFFVVIGVPASVGLIIEQSPLLLVYCMIMIFFNLLFTIVFGKLLSFNLEEVVLASNANIGGPTTAAAMAIAKGWNSLVVPILLIGTLGYIVGNYFGLLIGTLLAGYTN